MGDGHGSGLLGILGIAGCAAAFFVLKGVFPGLSRLLLLAGGAVVLLILLLVAVVLFFAFYKPKEKEGQKKAADTAQMMSGGRTALLEIRRIAMKVKNVEIRSLTEEICKKVDQIFRLLKDKPDSLTGTRQLFQYYLPALRKILQKYSRLEEGKAAEEEMTQHTIRCLGDIRSAMEKLYSNLFEDDLLDLTVEMEALTAACQRDGLLTEEDFQQKDGEITLTL